MEIFMSLDTKSMSKRIEPNKVDPYCIDLEDYENINDLIYRSIRTKTKFVPDHVPGAEYDSDKDIADLLGEHVNSACSDDELSDNQGEVEQSKDEPEIIADNSKDES